MKLLWILELSALCGSNAFVVRKAWHHPSLGQGQLAMTPPQAAVDEQIVVNGHQATTVVKDLKSYKLDSEPIIPFGGSARSQAKPDKQIVGGKGVGLQEMSRIGVDVPPGFTLITQLSEIFTETGDLPEEVWKGVIESVKRVEQDTGKVYGGKEKPLLFSCRSGAAISMPGMLDTVLNIGLNSETVEGLAKATGNPRFAYDAYRRLLDMFGGVVLGIPHEAFEERFDAIKTKAGVETDVDLNVEYLKELCDEYKQVYVEHDVEFPEDPYDQLFACIKAVFASWGSDRAIKYRAINGITTLKGTACNIQTMVFGNLGETSGTGVAFSRDPGTGVNRLYGEYLINAQGEDVVAGIRTPEPISKMAEVLPKAYGQFIRNIELLERHFKDMQDVEFTVEDGKLWLLQCRSGKRTGQAAFRIAIDMVEEGLCTPEEALLRIEPDHVKQMLHPNFPADVVISKNYKSNVVAVGLPGGPGAAVGKIVFSTKDAEEAKSKGEDVILVRENTSPEDVGGMWASVGILTARGGTTSHAAVVARGWGKPCVCGCEQVSINEKLKTLTVKATGKVFKEGGVISLNGATGEVLGVAFGTETPSLEGDLGTVLDWIDNIEDVSKVMANADSGPDAERARQLGARGIGLCRTEHMFFSPERLPIVRRWILRDEGLEQVQEFQYKDFKEILKAMNGLQVTIRLLDPPLHEFLPELRNVDVSLAEMLGYGDDTECLIDDIESMHEENPMLGLRGCRLAIVRPQLTVMQVEAIMHAAADLIAEDPLKNKPFPRIMIPLVGSLQEFKLQGKLIREVAERVKSERKLDIPYQIGTMIEVPRAALLADQIASVIDETTGKPLCEFFSYGTNDLTQTTFGISRDDAGVFLNTYLDQGIYERNPFVTIDTEAVGMLVRMSAAAGRAVNPNLSLSICGEHGGDAKSIEFFDDVGLDYVSCSPFRVPVARLAAGQASIRRRAKGNVKDARERVMSFNTK